jgi:hypothetical protein
MHKLPSSPSPCLHSVFIPPSSLSFFKFQPLSPINCTINKACASSSKSDTRNHTRDPTDTRTPTLRLQPRQQLQLLQQAQVSPPVRVPPVPFPCLHTDPHQLQCVLPNFHTKSKSQSLLSTQTSCTYSEA